MKIYNHNLFPVPVMYVEKFLPVNLAENIFNYALSIKNKITTTHGALQGDAVSLHGSNIEHNFIDSIIDNVSGCRDLKNNLMQIINAYASSIGHTDMVLANSWFNIQNKGSVLNNHCHITPRGIQPIMSGALYINTSPDTPVISFENPNPYIPIFKALDQITEYTTSYYSFSPEIGDLIIFPAWLHHSIQSPCTIDNRTVVSFNVK